MRTTWELVRDSRLKDEVCAFIWQRFILSRASFFLWRLLRDLLATDDALCIRGFHMVTQCLCGGAIETVWHLFLDYPRVRQRLAGFTFGFKPTQLRGIMDTQLGIGLRIIVPHTKPAILISWLRPPQRVVKLSVDGCSCSNLGRSASGGIFRDH